MSVPPQLIRVKRKAAEETPVPYLRVQDNKRHRSEVFVYRRQDEVATFADVPAPASKPVIHISQPPSQDATFQQRKRKHTLESQTKEVPANANDPLKFPRNADTGALDVPEQRRFHLSRPDAMLSTSSYPSRAHGGITRKRSSTALFVERRIKRISSKTVEKLQSAANDSASRSSTPTTEHNALSQEIPTGVEGANISTPEPKKYKKPGVSKRANQGDTSRGKSELPQSMANRWDVDMDRMTEEMNAFALEQIGLNIQKAEEEKKHKTTPQKAPSPLKFKPKAPAKRYSERHPETAPEPADKKMEDADEDVSDTDDDDYVVETYIRVPASNMGANVSPKDVGLLVFDDEPDIEYFYGAGSDSEDEWAEDEEDENAENYYAADYPDDEVASDDEFNMNAYAYRTGNASDLEEFGSDDDYDDLSYDAENAKGGFKTHVDRDGYTTNYL